MDAYYAGSSSARRIKDVAIPLLCIQARARKRRGGGGRGGARRQAAASCASALASGAARPRAHASSTPACAPLQAANDPIAPAAAIPYDAIRANPNCLLAVTPAGGHLGVRAPGHCEGLGPAASRRGSGAALCAQQARCSHMRHMPPMQWAAGPGAPWGHPWTDGAVTEWLAAVIDLGGGDQRQAAAAATSSKAAAAAPVAAAAASTASSSSIA